MEHDKIDTAAKAAGTDGGTAKPFVLTPENYYSAEANKRYLSNSSFKSLYGYPGSPWPCEAAALYGPSEFSEALLVGGDRKSVV